MKKYVLLLLFASFLHTIQAQNKRALDSLQTVYKNAQHDTIRVLVLNQIAVQYRGTKPDTSLFIAQKALEISEQTQNMRGKANSLTSIGSAYHSKSDYALALDYYQKSLQIAESVGDKQYIANSLGNIGVVYQTQSNYPLALNYFQRCLKIQEEVKNKRGIATVLTNLGLIYRVQGNIPLAITHYQRSLKIQEEIKDKRGASNNLNNLGVIYATDGNYPLALEYYQKSLVIEEELKNKNGIARNLTNMAIIYRNQQNIPLALTFYEKGLQIREEIKDKAGIASSLQSMAVLYQIQKMYDKSIEYAQKSLQIYQEIKVLKESKDVMTILYQTYKLQKNTEKALEYFESSRKLQDSIFSIEKSKAISTLTSTMDLERKEKAYTLLQKDNEITKVSAERNRLEVDRVARELKIKEKQAEADQLFALAKQEKDKRKADSLYALAQKKQLEADKLTAENKTQLVENQKHKIENQKQRESAGFQRVITYLILAGFMGVLVLAFFIYRSRQVQKNLNGQLSEKAQELTIAYNELQTTHEELHQTQEEIIAQRDYIETQNSDLQRKNGHINDSIKAALIIQQALLPFDKRVRGILKDYFVLYQPRDIVSGDFYWIEKIADEVLVVAGDCTGHGVPGAFMSLIAINLLEKVVLQDKVTSPAQVLGALHELVRSSLKQDEIDNQSGMDLAIVKITKDNVLYFSGAKRPLYYIDSSNPTEVRVCGGSRKSIGGLQSEAKIFDELRLDLPADSMFYLSSDGLVDQNDLKRKRLKEEPVLEALLATYKQPLENQRVALSQLLENHMMGTEQRDDILLLGVKI